MPIYVYHCASCGADMEKRQGFSDAPLTTCESCGGSVRRVLQPVGIIFKGSGFYVTDSRNGSAKGTDGKNGSAEKNGASAEQGASGDAKPAAAPAESGTASASDSAAKPAAKSETTASPAASTSSK